MNPEELLSNFEAAKKYTYFVNDKCNGKNGKLGIFFENCIKLEILLSLKLIQ